MRTVNHAKHTKSVIKLKEISFAKFKKNSSVRKKNKLTKNKSKWKQKVK